MFNLRLIVLVYRKGYSLIEKASSSWAVECSNHSDLKIYIYLSQVFLLGIKLK